tara:strand:+ start:212 stop:595 length:384 start_codon:yes stop_codon:yes gene_type:complete
MSVKALTARLSWFSALESFLELGSFTLLAEELGVSANTARVKVFNAIDVLKVDCKTKAEILGHKDWLPVRIESWKDIYLTNNDWAKSYDRGLFVDTYLGIHDGLGYANNTHVRRIAFALYDAGARFK